MKPRLQSPTNQACGRASEEEPWPACLFVGMTSLQSLGLARLATHVEDANLFVGITRQRLAGPQGQGALSKKISLFASITIQFTEAEIDYTGGRRYQASSQALQGPCLIVKDPGAQRAPTTRRSVPATRVVRYAAVSALLASPDSSLSPETFFGAFRPRMFLAAFSSRS